ncbi:PH domain-containing protein [Anoxybacillus sp. UARK-01]|uniref:PH domain-containing protein n=1 Tax=Anoxybacillus sp. UARK-01 TaxID=1895648 RepID=UPI001F36DC30|nr:PH domain-containing protein [Anoxybacillus sp. UARK-01]
MPTAVHLELGTIAEDLAVTDKILLTVICSLFTLFLLSGWFHTLYIVTDKALKIRGGLFSWTIPLEEIEAITESKNPLSAPALSLDRLQITYGKSKFILISPKDKSLFLKQIKKIRPDVLIEGEISYLPKYGRERFFFAHQKR